MEEGNDTSYKLMQAFGQLKRQWSNAGPIAGLKHSEWGVLRGLSKLDDGQGVMVSELSAGMKVSAPSITQTVNGLVSRGLVSRQADPCDRRAVRLRVTESGEETLALALKEFKSRSHGLVEFLGEKKSADLMELLHQVHKYFETLG